MTVLMETPKRARRGSTAGYPQHILLEDVSWKYYLKTLDELEGQPQRVTYDNGRMEIMSPPGSLHEYAKRCIGRLLETYATEADINITGVGEVMTHHRELKKGLQPDECYWVQSKQPSIVRGWLVLHKAPRPDLVVEVEITSGMIRREPIYAAFGVPEIWRFRQPRI